MGEFLNSRSPIERHGGRLPHWQQGEVLQFVTFRLGDALPAVKLRRWRQERDIWLQKNPRPWTAETAAEYAQRFTGQLEAWLDEGAGSCLLRDPSARAEVVEAMTRFEGIRVVHHAWVVMPNHVHALFQPLHPLEKLVKAWKGVSARGIGRGSIWQPNYRDTAIRDGAHYERVVRYIRRNPSRLPLGHSTHWESPRAQRVP